MAIVAPVPPRCTVSEPQSPRRSSPVMKAIPWGIAILAIVAVAWWLNRPAPDDSATGVPSSSESVPAPELESEVTPEDATERWTDATGAPPAWPEPFVGPTDCDEAVERLEALCAVLDDRDYVKKHRHEGGACGFLQRVSADLEVNPPTIHGELKDLLDVKHSVSHLYRSLGEKRLLQMAEMVALEPDLAEPMAIALYRWNAVRDRCPPDGPRGMSASARYDYATWLLRTIGGQAYLRRRAPRYEALATFYALVVLDASVERGYDPAGVDLRKDLARATDLIGGRDDLVFRDRYLAILRDMEARWNRRAGGASR